MISNQKKKKAPRPRLINQKEKKKKWRGNVHAQETIKKKAILTLPMCIAHVQFCHFTIKLPPPSFLSILERQILCGLAWKILGPNRKITLPPPYQITLFSIFPHIFSLSLFFFFFSSLLFHFLPNTP